MSEAPPEPECPACGHTMRRAAVYRMHSELVHRWRCPECLYTFDERRMA